MTKDKLKAFVKDKLAEWFDEEDARYQKRQALLEQQEELRKKLREEIRWYSYSEFGDEVMGNMKTMIILILVICGMLPFIF